MKYITLVLTLFLFHGGFAQTAYDSSQAATVVVHKDPRIDMLIRKKAAINKTARKSSARTMRGYRLMVINTSNRNEAIAAKTKIYTYYPELKAYLQYQTPYFKLKAGNFQTREDAEKYRRRMATMFPKGVFIVHDTIEVKPEKEREEG